MTALPAAPAQPHVIILMAVYNGERYLAEQLDSLIAQSHPSWSLIASDDGSSDDSLAVLRDYAATGLAIEVVAGPRQGAAQNFLSLLRHAGPRLTPNTMLAFCDQDDVWHATRLSNGIEQLAVCPATDPAMACSGLMVVDEDLRNPRRYARRPRPPAFRNALLQNIASGNTTLFNPAAARLVCAAAQEAGRVVVHDWWAYQLVTGCGGRAIYDDRPGLLYRQHGKNDFGASGGAHAKLRRITMVINGTLRGWNRINIAALNRSAHRFTDENREIMRLFSRLCDGTFTERLNALRNGQFYRQSRASTLAVWISGLLGRL